MFRVLPTAVASIARSLTRSLRTAQAKNAPGTGRRFLRANVRYVPISLTQGSDELSLGALVCIKKGGQKGVFVAPG